MSFFPTSGQGSTSVTSTIYTANAGIDRTYWQEATNTSSATAMQTEEAAKKAQHTKYSRYLGTSYTI